MTTISAIDKPLFWSAQTAADTVLETGITPVGNTTISGLTLISDASENAYLGKVVGKAGDYKPLPDSGWLEAGDIYGYGGGLVIVRQPHNRTIYAPDQHPALFCVYRAGAGVLDWVAGEKVEKGTRRMYGGKEYTALQAHVTQSDWTPDRTLGTLWSVVATTAEWAAGVAYKVGDIVTYQGKTYQCLQAHTSISTWTPSAVPALWKLVG